MAFVSEIEVVAVLTLRGLLTLALTSLMFLVFMATSLGCLWQGGPLRNCALQPSTDSGPWPCSLHLVSVSATPSPCTGGLEYCGGHPWVSSCSEVGTVACGRELAPSPLSLLLVMVCTTLWCSWPSGLSWSQVTVFSAGPITLAVSASFLPH